MNIVIGATGRVGTALVNELVKRDMPVLAIARNKNKFAKFDSRVQCHIADVFDLDTLIKAFNGEDTVFLMTPENFHSNDVLGDAERMLEIYREVVYRTGVRRVIGLSSMGAHLEAGSGNLYISHMLEQAFAGLPVETTFIRPAYYYSNWMNYIEVARTYGILPTFFHPHKKIAMVSPGDVACFAAIVMRSRKLSAPLYEIEGPKTYSAHDIARFFSEYLKREVTVQQIPQEQWIPTLTKAGFSPDAAHNMALMTQAVMNTISFGENTENKIIWNTEFEDFLGGQKTF
ncbi:NAD-dependent epimerase/dehydratase family protein [Palleniella muris]|uniref:NAD-dependent epimerase/dehydratase family protein n=1 Tax=Palleniella muris TaxID=3038145 RepID=A0AC61QLF8_9BACT|nr:NAD(P)H-binding protein [Palleniella muris]TGX79461.1 NAD-dependent epimerase/dehydratase family protein [Palleniella muris]